MLKLLTGDIAGVFFLILGSIQERRDYEQALKKGDGLLCQRIEIKYSFINQHKKTWPIERMCQVLGVKRQNYYAWMRRQVAHQPDPNREKKIDLVRKAAMESGFTYGTRRIKKSLADHHYPVSRGEARRLMKAAKVEVRQRKKFRITTNSEHNKRVYDNVLDRHFRVERLNQVYVGDITYIWTNEGWLYLAVIIDLYSRKVVGWSMGKRMTARLVCDALTMAIWRRKPAQGLVVHSDQGSQYASHAYRRLIDKNGFTGSMSRKGNCWDTQSTILFEHHSDLPRAGIG